MEKLNPYEFLEFIVTDEKIKSRKFLEKMDISSRHIRRACRENNIYVNGKRTFENVEVKKGDSVAIKFPDESLNALCQYKDIDICYEDYDLLIVNKEYNCVTHTAKDDSKDTLLNYLAGYFEKNNIKRKVRFVNRLDRDTSGLIIVAKNSYAHAKIMDEFSNNQVDKIYLAICRGDFKEKQGEIVKKISLCQDGIRREVDDNNGKYAKTKYQVLKDNKKLALVKLKLFTGRTHQIRVHLKSIGHPIIGDKLYNDSNEEQNLLDRQALHSYSLSFKLPRTGELKTFTAKLSDDMDMLNNEISWNFSRIIV